MKANDTQIEAALDRKAARILKLHSRFLAASGVGKQLEEYHSRYGTAKKPEWAQRLYTRLLNQNNQLHFLATKLLERPRRTNRKWAMLKYTKNRGLPYVEV